jgi:hypothetical protein
VRELFIWNLPIKHGVDELHELPGGNIFGRFRRYLVVELQQLRRGDLLPRIG